MIQDLQTIFVHLMQPADQWHLSSVSSENKEPWCYYQRSLPNESERCWCCSNQIRPDAGADSFEKLIEDYICQRCVLRPLQSNEAAQTTAVKTNQRQWCTSCNYLITHKDNSCHFLLPSELTIAAHVNRSSYCRHQEFCSVIWNRFYQTQGSAFTSGGVKCPRIFLVCFGMIGNSTNLTEWKEKERESEKERAKSKIVSTSRSCDLTLLYAFSQRTLEGEQGGGPSSNNLRI